MATLTANINSTQTVIPVSGTAPETGSYFTAGSEAIRFLGTSRGPGGRAFRRTYWSVDRGIAGTTAASHLSGVTLTQYYPESSGGGGGSISATDGTTTVDPATSIQFPSGALEDAGGGVALVRIAGSGDTSATFTADEDTIPVLIFAPVASEDNGTRLFVIVDEAQMKNLLSFDANGFLDIRGPTDTSLPGAELRIRTGGEVTKFRLLADDGNGVSKAGFFGANAVAQPEVPATPTAQDVVDALVALGLVTQAP